MFLAPRKIGAVLRVLVAGLILLALGEVTLARVVHAAVAPLLTLGEVTTVVLLERLSLYLLTGREPGVLVVAVVVMLVVTGVIVVVVVMRMIVTMTGIVVGMLAHARTSQRFVEDHSGAAVKPRPMPPSAGRHSGPEAAHAELCGEYQQGHGETDIQRERHVRP